VQTSTALSRAPRPSSLADVLDLILDKGLVIDAYVRVSLAGIELLTIDARIVVASVDTYLRFAEAVNRLDLGQTEEKGLPALFGHGDGEGEQPNGKRGSEGDGRQGADRKSRQRELGAGQGSRPRSHQSRARRDGDDDRGSVGLMDRITERARR
jgi:hypothetical protein